MTEQLHFHFLLSRIGEGNGKPLQYSCLENPRDGEAWWAAIYGVAQSRTRLKRLSNTASSRHFYLCSPQYLHSKMVLIVLPLLGVDGIRHAKHLVYILAFNVRLVHLALIVEIQ